ncbi:helix-turn-helix transcriptional regulator [Spongiimicrobium salis]|uniref:helix-turn-helix transcriptional regulator n=1 Tax=Spongiimicrobium salis TaxID=1667022 RepID=UPI00374CBB82
MRKEYLGILFLLLGANLIFAQTKIIATGDQWEYYDLAEAPPANWIIGANNPGWKKGSSPLGYGDSKIESVISFGDDKKNKHITKYFKKTFRIEDNYEYLIYELKIQRDDGIVVYINGREFLRNNMPQGKIDNDTKASSLILASGEDEILTKLIYAEDLIPGFNTISVSVHQARPTSSDCIFNLELIGNNDAQMIPRLLKENTIKNLKMDLRLKEINHSQELEHNKIQYDTLQESKSRIENLFIVICVLLFLGILGVLFFAKTLYDKLQKSRVKVTKLEETNTTKDREMMSLSLSSLNNQQFLKGLKKEFESYTQSDSAAIKRDMRQIIKQIEYNISHEDDWGNLKKHFNAIHTGYFDQLISLHPNLTEVELRHCIFIKLHMQTKEIAKILNIDPRSVQVSRYRIKKKMELPENVDLRDYLLKV